MTSLKLDLPDVADLESGTKVLDQSIGDTYALYNADNCLGIKGIPDNTVGLTVSSLPFMGIYIYSDSEADMGNSEDQQFWDHMDYLIPELYRVTIPGRLCVMHCKDLPLYRGRDGAAGLRDFPGEIIRAFERGGWTFHSRVTIWKDPVTEMQRTKNHGLLYKICRTDTSASRQGMADYLVVFRKTPADSLLSDQPVCNGTNPERFDHYVGLDAPDAGEVATQVGSFPPSPDPNGRWPKINLFPEGSEAYRLWSIMVWQRYASPVWMDTDQMDVLQYREARDEHDERHICPLGLDVIERAIHLWSNPGDVVLDPFMGIGSTGYVATSVGRKAIGLELKPSYFRQSVRHLSLAETKRNRPTLWADTRFCDVDVEHDPFSSTGLE